MARGSDKHGSRLDTQLDKETHDLRRGTPVSGRVEELRLQEAPGDDEPVADEVLRRGGDMERIGNTLSPQEAELRSEIAASIDGRAFPGTREQLLESARDNDARAPIVTLMEQLPDGTYENVADVWTALGGRMEQDNRR